MMRRFSWTEENVNRLRDLMLRGESSGQIAKELGISRNSVVSKIHRSKELLAIGLSGMNGAQKAAKIKGEELHRKDRIVKPLVVNKEKHTFHSGNMAAKKNGEFQPLNFLAPKPTVSALEYANNSKRVPLADLGRMECRWAVNDAQPGEEHLFCGRKTDDQKSFCLFHQKLAYQPRSEVLRAKKRAENIFRRAA